MRIVLVAEKFAPFSGASEKANEVAAIAAQLSENDQQIEAIFPMGDEVSPEKFSLAKRLRKIEVTVDGNTCSFERYDGRTNSNTEVHLLHQTGESSHNMKALSKAAVTLMGPPKEEDCICIWWNLAPPSFDNNDSNNAGWRHVVVITHSEGPWDNPLNADKVVVIGRKLANIIKNRNVSIVPKAVNAVKKVGPKARASAKVSLQSYVGLPVRSDVPLILFSASNNPDAHAALKKILTMDVQVILQTEKTTYELNELTERYSDRLAVSASQVSEDLLLSGSDLTLVLSSESLALSAMATGSVPVVNAAYAEGIVELEPSLRSGSGFIMDLCDEASIIAALERGIAAFYKGEDFRALSLRIPSFVIDKTRQTSLLLQTITS